MDKRECFCTVGENEIDSHYGRRYGDSLKKLRIKPPHDPAVPHLGIYPEEIKIERHMYPIVHCGTIYNG